MKKENIMKRFVTVGEMDAYGNITKYDDSEQRTATAINRARIDEEEEFLQRSDILPDVIGVEEAAELTGYTAGYIKNLCAEGKFAAKKIGKTWVMDKSKLIGWKNRKYC